MLDDHPEELKALLKNLLDAAEADPSSFGGCTPHFDSQTLAGGIVEEIRARRCHWDIIVADVFMPAGERGEPDADSGAVAVYNALALLDETVRPFLVMTSNRPDDAAPILTPLLRAQHSLAAPWAVFFSKPTNAALAGCIAPLHSVDDWRQLVVWAIASRKDLEWRRAFIESGFDEVATPSLAFQQIKAQVIRFARNKVIAVVGETGSGKERVAQSLHEISRRTGQFRKENLQSQPLTLVESAIFGAVRGAFTGCDRTRVGWLGVCNHGTLFLDEFGSDHPDLAVTGAIELKLRRVMSGPAYDYCRLGDEETIHRFDGGLILGGSRLEALLERAETEERWKDFFGRVDAVIRVPPLRDHPEDILPLARHFLERETRAQRLATKTLTKDAEEALKKHGWPENIRELEKVMKKVAGLKQTDIAESDLQLKFVAKSTGGGVPGVRADPGTPEGMESLLKQFGSNQVKVANYLGVTPNRVLQLIRQHRAADPAFRAKFPRRR